MGNAVLGNAVLGSIRLPLFITWSHTREYMQLSYRHTATFLSYINDYWSDKRNKWVFLPNYTVPMCLQYITNEVEPEWVYDSRLNTLTSDDITTTKKRLDWLSLQITIHGDQEKIYDMDDFLSTFIICTGADLPKLSMIYVCWCIYSKKWFPSMVSITFNVIDANGDERYLAVDQYSILREIKN